MSALVRSVNVGMPREATWAEIGRTSIDKRPVTGPVSVARLGLDGDQVSDTRHHGGVDQAVYAFSREDLDFWAGELGRDVRDGQFGENLTTEGIDVNEAEIGERWRIGTTELEVASIRIPWLPRPMMRPRRRRRWWPRYKISSTGWRRRPWSPSPT